MTIEDRKSRPKATANKLWTCCAEPGAQGG